MAKKTTDNKVLALLEQVNQQKKEIQRAEGSKWITNCAFSYTEEPSKAINLHVEGSVRNLICIVAFLRERERTYNDAASTLGVDAPIFTWSGFRVDDWISDIKMRIDKIQISTKKKKLELLESRLSAVMTPELKAQIELDAIEKELGVA